MEKNKFIPQSWNWNESILKEIKALKTRVEDLETRGLKIIEDSWTILNDEHMEEELKKVIEEIRDLVKKHGIITISVTTDKV